MTPMKHKWIRGVIPPGENGVVEKCLFCGALSVRYRLGRNNENVPPCDWSKITDRAILAEIINARLSFSTLRSRAWKRYKPSKKVNSKKQVYDTPRG
jgi:hypothetical protein